MRRSLISVLVRGLVPVSVILVLGSLSSCGEKSRTSEDGRTGAVPDSLSAGCVQLEVAIGGGFEVDGRSVSDHDLRVALRRAYEARERNVPVDVRCSEGVTMAAVAELHDAMLALGMHSIQYENAAGELLPYMLPPSEMTARLSNLPPEALAHVGISTNGVRLNGRGVGDGTLEQGIRVLLEDTPSLVVAVEADAEVPYVEFVAILGEVLAAGATRVAIEISPSSQN